MDGERRSLPRRGRAPEPVRRLLGAAVPGLAERLLERDIREAWPHVAGGDLARRSAPTALRGGTLEVTADNSPWLQELKMREAALLEALRGRWGDQVRGLRFALGSLPPAHPAPPAATPRAPGRLTPEEAGEVEALVSTLSAPEAAAALRRLLTKDRLARRARTPAPGDAR